MLIGTINKCQHLLIHELPDSRLISRPVVVSINSLPWTITPKNFTKNNSMPVTFYQIAGDEPGTSIYINPLHVVRVVPNGSNARIYLSDKTSYDVAQTASVVQANIQHCMQ